MEKKKNSFTAIGAIFNFLSGLSSILSYIGVPIALIFLFFKQYTGLIIVVVTIAFLLFISFYPRKNSDKIIKKILRLFAPSATYSFSSWKATYEYHSNELMSFHTRYNVKALQTGVECIRVRFTWSGASEKNPIHPKPCKTEGCTTKSIEYEGDEFGYKFYKVYNKTRFNKGDPEVKLGIDIDNMKVTKDKPVSNHLATNINVITDELTMRVLLPSNLKPTNIRALEYLHSTDHNHWKDLSDESKCKSLDDGTGRWEIALTVSEPVYGGKYFICWDLECH